MGWRNVWEWDELTDEMLEKGSDFLESTPIICVMLETKNICQAIELLQEMKLKKGWTTIE